MPPIRSVDLASKALCAVKTARRWLRPELRASMKPATAERLRRAAVELGWRDEPAARAGDTHIHQNVEIVVTGSDSPSRIARQISTELSKLTAKGEPA